MPREPETDLEWQIAADAADAALALHWARKFGMVAGGSKINVDRCAKIIVAAKGRGILPRQAALDHFVRELVQTAKEATDGPRSP